KFSDEQIAIRDTILKLCEGFSPEYWLECDNSGRFPEEFVAAIRDGGWYGIAMPEEYGGSGLGITEAAIMMQAVTESGAGFTGASGIHLNLFGLNPVVVFGTDEQKRRMLPPLLKGEDSACFGVTEPNAGLDTTNLQVRADRHGDGYVIHGQKHW